MPIKKIVIVLCTVLSVFFITESVWATEETWYRCTSGNITTAPWKKFSTDTKKCPVRIGADGKVTIYLQFGKQNAGGGELTTPVYPLEFTYNALAASPTISPSATPAATATGTQSSVTPAQSGATATPTTVPTATPKPTATPTPGLPAEKVKYDLNGDKLLNTLDVGAFKQIWRSGLSLSRIDFNGDGTANIFDYQLLLQNINR